MTKEVGCSNSNIMMAIVVTRFGGGDDIRVMLTQVPASNDQETRHMVSPEKEAKERGVMSECYFQ